MKEISQEDIQSLGSVITQLITNNSKQIIKAWKNSESDKYSFSIGVTIREATQDGELVHVIDSKISYSEKHSEAAEIVLRDKSQIRMVE